MRNLSRSISQKTLRVDVDVEFDAPLRLRRVRKPFAQISREIETSRRLDQEAQAMAAAHQSKRCVGGAEYADLIGRRTISFRRGAGERARIARRLVPVGPGDDEAREPAERWIV